MALKMKEISIVPIAALALLAGCVEDAPTDVHHGFPREFTAHYSGNDGTDFTLQLVGPTNIADHDLVLREAYRLYYNQSLPEAARAAAQLPDPFVTIYHLDGQMRLMRTTWPCWNPDVISCQYANADWMARGALPPSGVGWPSLLEQSDSLVYWQGAKQLAADIDVSSTAKWLTIDIGDGDAWMVHPGVGGRLIYEKGSWVPTTIQSTPPDQGSQPVVATLSSVTYGPPLPPIDAWPSNAQDLARAENRRGLFPGSNAGLWNSTWTFDSALAALLDQSRTANDYWNDEGCIRSFWARSPDSALKTGLLPRARFQIDVQSGGGPGGSWRVEYEGNPVVPTYAVGTNRGMQTELRCEDITTGYAPVIDAQTMHDQATRFPVSRTEDALNFGFTRGLYTEAFYGERYGHEVYVASAWPAHLESAFGGTAYNLGLLPATGTWRGMTVHPNDIAALDRGEFLAAVAD